MHNNQRNNIANGEDYTHSVYKIDECMYFDELYKIFTLKFELINPHQRSKLNAKFSDKRPITITLYIPKNFI